MEAQIRSEIRALSMKNEEEHDDIMENIQLLYRGDFSNITFFDQFFNLPSGRSFSVVSSIDQFYMFLLQSFCQNESPELTYKSLLVIYRLICCHIDLSFLFNDEFIQHSIALFSHPNKLLASYSLSTLHLFTKRDDKYLNRCIELNYISEIENVATFPEQVEIDEDVQFQCFKAVARSVIDLCKINTLTANPTYFEIFLRISHVMFFSTIPILNKYGLEILKCIIESSTQDDSPIELTEEMSIQFLNFADSAPDFVLNNLFELISIYARDFGSLYSQLEAFLTENHFFMRLIQRIEEDARYTMMIFQFFDAIEYEPEDEDPIIPKLIEIITNGTRENKVAGLKYLHSLIKKRSTDFCVYLASNGIIHAFFDEIEGRTEIMNEVLEMVLKVIDSLIAAGIDLTEVEEIMDLFESLQKLLNDYSCSNQNFEVVYNIEFIESIVAKFPEV